MAAAVYLYLAVVAFITQTQASQSRDVFTLFVSSRKNETGHTVAEASVQKEGDKVSDQWKLKVQRSLTDAAGITQFKLSALAVAPPRRPEDYIHYPGVGYYKFHSNHAAGFDEALRTCAMEGGHLAIANSETEHQILSSIFSSGKGGSGWAFVGFHDRITEGNYVTIFGEPLASTGFTRWCCPGQPDDAGRNEDCGSIHRNGGYNDIHCASSLPFICEYDLSWAESWK